MESRSNFVLSMEIKVITRLIVLIITLFNLRDCQCGGFAAGNKWISGI